MYVQKFFESQRNETLSELGKTYKPVMDFVIMNPLTGKQELVELIKKPRWNYLGADREPQNTFIPDFLSFYEDKSTKNYYYYILDAKYYCPEFNGKSIRKNPGVEGCCKTVFVLSCIQVFLR